MSDISRLLQAAEQGDPSAASQLLPLVYDELRQLAARQLADEKPGQTLDATALVHEAYLRLAGDGREQHWDNRRHFFAAAAEAMRRILVDRARRKGRGKHGGGRRRVPLEEAVPAPPSAAADVLALDEALTRLAAADAEAAAVVQLRYFGGLSVEEAAQCLGLSRPTAYRHWTFARAWLRRELADDGPA
jgi:RNA polymerase sigma factor (TIGR02999 family)